MSRRGLAIVVIVQLAALIAVCLLVGDNGWDDGAITLAFSRTFAQHGLIALTPHSEVVEGFSSVSWFLLNALAALARPSYYAAILISQVLSTLCVCASTILLARTCALLGLDKLFSTLTVLTFAAWGCSFSEASNGMEMGLLTVAFLIMVNELLSPEPRIPLLGAGVVLAVTTRFEAVAYVTLLGLGVVFVPKRRAFWTICVACAGTAALLTLWRLAVFSDILPNTIWAKRWPPYPSLDPEGRLVGAMQLPGFFLVPLIAFELLLRSGFDVSSLVQSRRRAFSVLACPILGAVLVGALIGKPWGYSGRMQYFAFPLVLLLLALILSSWVNAQTSRLTTRARTAVAVALCAISIGVSMKGFPSGPLSAAFAGGAFGVTPHTYAESGRVLRRFASAAGLKHPSILSPDVGGLALCCDEFRIVDLGLLSNRKLAQRGLSAVGEVLEAESPDMVEAHWRWASSANLYELPYFRAHYVPAFAGGTKLWIRRDVANAIESRGRGCWLATDGAELRKALSTHRYANHDLPEDRTAFERPGVVLALDEADAGAASLCNGASRRQDGGRGSR